MEILSFTDINGDVLGNMIYEDGYLGPYLVDEENYLTRVKHTPWHPGDILFPSFPRCGNHWIWEIARILLQQKHADKLHTQWMELFMDMCDIRDLPDKKRMVSTHLRPKFLPTDFLRNRIPIVFVVRNPKDVIISWYKLLLSLVPFNYSGKWDGFFELHLDGNIPYGNYLDHLLDWEKFIDENPDYPIYIACYEDFKKDHKNATQKLAEFLKMPFSDPVYDGILEKTSISKLTQKTDENLPNWEKKAFKKQDVTIIGKGISGAWKDMFTVNQNERYDQQIETKMKNSQFKFIYD